MSHSKRVKSNFEHQHTQGDVICLLQARMSSSRLPEKVLKKVNGIPLVVLAAKRAANTGLAVKVVTSNEPSDDVLAVTLSAENIPYFRGDLHNTLARFNDALAEYSDESIVVRLTADNLFPDGRFIEKVLAYFNQHELDYVGTTGEKTGLPYGVSAEVFRVKSLRESYRHCHSTYSQEHVTPDIINKFGVHLFTDDALMNLGHLRATIDTHDDLHWIRQVFKEVDDPFEHDYRSLCSKLQLINKRRQYARLIMGGAQIGMDYGITNNKGKPGVHMVREMIENAHEHGVSTFDTAQAYGDSEDVLKPYIASSDQVITKLLPIQCNAFSEHLTHNIELKINASLAKFENRKISLLLHRAEDMLLNEGAVWQVLQRYRTNNRLEKIGVSIQSPKELEPVLHFKDIDIIQLPFNLVDNRWKKAINKLTQYRQKRDMQIHVRSVLLQGLLLSQNNELWQRAHVSTALQNSIYEWLSKMVQSSQCGSLKELLIRYVASQPWCDKLVIGMQNNQELIEALNIITLPPFSAVQLNDIETSMPKLSNRTLNPANWIQ